MQLGVVQMLVTLFTGVGAGVGTGMIVGVGSDDGGVGETVGVEVEGSAVLDGVLVGGGDGGVVSGVGAGPSGRSGEGVVAFKVPGGNEAS